MTKTELLDRARACQNQARRYADRQNSECDLPDPERVRWQNAAADALDAILFAKSLPDAKSDVLDGIAADCVEVRNYFTNPGRTVLRPKACSFSVTALLDAGNVLESMAKLIPEPAEAT